MLKGLRENIDKEIKKIRKIVYKNKNMYKEIPTYRIQQRQCSEQNVCL